MNACLPADNRASMLWTTWLHERSPATRDAIHTHYQPWLRRIAGHYAYRQLTQRQRSLMDWGDFLHCGTEGLLRAIDRYDPSRETRFETYAEHFVRGAILRGLRSFRMESCGFDAGDEAQAVDLALAFFLDTGLPDTTLPQALDPCLLQQHRQQVARLSASIARLPPREQQLVRLHYEQDVCLADIAHVLGVSRPRITQLHAQAVARMRTWLESPVPSAPPDAGPDSRHERTPGRHRL